MGINVYLRDGMVQTGSEAVGLHQQAVSIYVSSKGAKTRHDETGRCFVAVPEPTVTLPKFLLEYVEEITYLENFELVPMREYGVYSLGAAASATVLPFVYAGALWGYEIRVTKATRMEDVSSLVEAILDGSIRPTRSFADPQSGLSREDLEAKVAELERKLQEQRNSWAYLNGTLIAGEEIVTEHIAALDKQGRFKLASTAKAKDMLRSALRVLTYAKEYTQDSSQ